VKISATETYELEVIAGKVHEDGNSKEKEKRRKEAVFTVCLS